MDAVEPRKKICGARRKNGNGLVCQLPPARGRTRCRFHGGHSPVGMASATWKTGRYSKYFPTGLRKKYEAFLNDPLTLSLNHEIATCDTHMTELIAELARATKGNQPAETIWNRILSGMEARRRLVESQRKYELDMGRMLSADKAQQLIAGLSNIVTEVGRRFIQNPESYRAFCIAVCNRFIPLINSEPQDDSGRARNF